MYYRTKKVLLENQIVKSEDFTAADWIKAGCTVTPNDAIAPDGTLSADKIVFESTSRQIYQLIPSITTLYTFSVYVKGTAGQTISIGNGDAVNSFDTLTGQWQRIKIITSIYAGRLVIHNYSGNALVIWLWGAQANLGSLMEYLKKT